VNRTRAWAGAVAGSIALADGVLYLVLIHRQGDSSAVVPVVFSLIALAALAAVAGWVLSPGAVPSMLLGGSAAMFLVLGVLGVFSIGLPLLIAAGFSLLGVHQSGGRQERSTGPGRRVALASLGVAGVLLAALLLFQIGRGGTTESVTCSGSAHGSGMPTVPGAAPSRVTQNPSRCRTITSP
jgi:hypothetical protein